MNRTIEGGLKFGVNPTIFADYFVEMSIVTFVELFEKLGLACSGRVRQDRRRDPDRRCNNLRFLQAVDRRAVG